MKFSVIVPVYNVEDYLDDCIKSILMQTYTDFELLLIDDGSPDRCGEMCDSYAKEDNRIKVIHKQNGGLADARNAGLEEAKGEYVIFIDSDDKISYTDALKDIAIATKNYPETEVFVTKTWKHNTKKTIKGSILLKTLLEKGFSGDMFRVTVWDKVYKRTFIEKNGFVFCKGYVHEDLLWTFNTIACATLCTILDKDFYERNINDNSITRSESDKSTYNRAMSKLNISHLGCKLFNNDKFDSTLQSVVFKFYIGVYIGGLLEGKGISNNEYASKYNSDVYKTSQVLKYGWKTDRLLYKLVAVLYIVFGNCSTKLIQRLIREG